jgi:hypothetical protein
MAVGVLLALATGGARAGAQEGFLRAPDWYNLNIVAVTYDDGDTDVKLEATERLPEAHGEAKVERNDGITEIEVELDDMKPAWSFGGDFSTYVLWAVSPEGHIDNLGEFILKGDDSELEASTTMDAFGLLVTAEPHFMVGAPSPFLVLANREPNRAMPRPPARVELEVVYSSTPYRYERSSLAGIPEFDGETRSALRQAQVAVLLAEQADARRLAPEAFEAAESALVMAQGAAETRSAVHEDVELMARRAVRLAVTAERMAIEVAALGTAAARLR